MRILLEAPLGIRDADHAEQLERAGARLRRRHAEVDLGRLGQLTPHGEDGVQRGHRLLEDHADLAPADVAHLGVREAQEIAALEEDLAAYDAAGWRRHEAHDAEGAHGLAAAGLAHEGHRLPLANVPGHAVDRADDAGRRSELCLEVLYFEEKVSAPLHGPGSLAQGPGAALPECRALPGGRGAAGHAQSRPNDPDRLEGAPHLGLPEPPDAADAEAVGDGQLARIDDVAAAR